MNLCNTNMILEEKYVTLEKLSGLPIDELINRFAQGYELTLPENMADSESMADFATCLKESNKKSKKGMNLQTVIELLEKEYERAKKLEFVRNPCAYALYQVWKTADKKGC